MGENRCNDQAPTPEDIMAIAGSAVPSARADGMKQTQGELRVCETGPAHTETCVSSPSHICMASTPRTKQSLRSISGLLLSQKGEKKQAAVRAQERVDQSPELEENFKRGGHLPPCMDQRHKEPVTLYE
jgi:hypothetical protein